MPKILQKLLKVLMGWSTKLEKLQPYRFGLQIIPKASKSHILRNYPYIPYIFYPLLDPMPAPSRRPPRSTSSSPLAAP